MKHQRILAASAGAVGLLYALGAQAVELEAGDWTFSANGNINVHYIYSTCEDSPAAITTVGSACSADADGNDTNSSVSNGLLPAALVFGAGTEQDGYDLNVTFGFYPGISSNDGGSPNLQQDAGALGTNVALATTGLDVRQVFISIGTDNYGSFKLGRDFGLFGFDAIINDMTIPGVGVPGAMATGAPANTSLGSIGFGYIYTDTLGQMNYTTPSFGGATFTAGIFDPIDPLIGGQGGAANNSAPGFHGKLAWAGDLGGMGTYLSAAFISQEQISVGGVGNDYTSTGFDIYGRIEVANLKASAYYYSGSGMGTTGLFVLSDDGAGNERDSDGYLLQLTYPVGKTTFGVNYGVSNLDHANSADAAAVPNLLETNSKITGGIYHALTSNLTLLFEINDVETEAHNGASNSAQSANIGAFMSF
ncbi:porin [Algiphilus sp.]|uniref:porin n=1 Tax=Algiphilus sp. TaxID=1872431 RepID=UPI001CA76A4F|nr:porin [Algiphilus sp.]MBY8964842.1 porin [Algiphilus acroporae]MCI5102364.1 porin [Algiphilus sp.]MCR9089845.1 porin [Pseudomonadota bacterium]